MSSQSSKLSRFWQEMKRRKTDRVIVVYAATAFVILQLTDILTGGLALPEWIMTLIIIIIATGFPVAAIFSWFFDITPGGIEKTKPADAGKRKEMADQLRTWKEITMVSVIVIIALIIFNIIRGDIKSSDIKKAEKSIAVLPFENLTPNEVLPYTTDVITSIIISDLREINVLQVRSRREVLDLNTKNRSISEIAKKLDVSFLVTGELVNSKDLVLVNIDLIRTSKKKVFTIWANKYLFDPKANISALSEIAIDIGKRLKIILSNEERSRISKRPTVNTAAFLNYVEGTTYQDDAYNGYVYLSRGDSIFKDLSVAKSFDRALFFYDKAIKADSSFALAYARRAITRSWGYQAKHLTSTDQMEKCRNDIEKALQIDKNLTDAKVAYGFYYYYFVKDYSKAMEYFREVSVKEPRNWACKFYMAIVYRAWGEWEQSQILIKEVVKNNLQDPLFLTNIGLSYQSLHQYDTAIYYHNKAIEMMPGWSGPWQNKIESMVLRDGNTREAEIVLDTAEKRTTGGFFPSLRIVFDLYNERYKEALIKAETAGPLDFQDPGTRYLLLAEIYKNLKNPEMAVVYYKSALEFYTKLFENNPDDPSLLSYIGIASAGLKDRKKALDSGQKAIELTKYNSIEKSDRLRDYAKILVMLGEYEKSLTILDGLLKKPSSISIKLIQIDPVWKPLLKRAEFKKLVYQE